MTKYFLATIGRIPQDVYTEKTLKKRLKKLFAVIAESVHTGALPKANTELVYTKLLSEIDALDVGACIGVPNTLVIARLLGPAKDISEITHDKVKN